ncbi:MAG: T9SS type A sorting domain-containing protein, partial [Melioribacteraceae bacterium]|nr:T9SS type A sorting domain-containing protein [Melioribacteraceae bacterium]
TAVYQWVATMALGFEPSVVKGEVFAVVAINDGVLTDYSNEFGVWADNNIGHPGWKYYEEGRLSTDQPGWWARMYSWDFAVAVNITGDLSPTISDVTILGTTLSTEARTIEATITDENPGGGDAGIASANLLYTIDDGSEVSVPMTANGDVYSADIPGQVAGTTISYSVEATDVLGLHTRWARDVTYKIFAIENPNALLVFNGPDAASGYPQSYYFGGGNYPYGDPKYALLAWDHDSWAYGALTEELVNGYNNIIEIATSGPAAINNDVVAAWLAGDATRNYMLAGDEWLGVQYGWPNPWTTVDIPDGDFAKDILGISVYYPDINYAASGDQALPSNVNAIEGSLLGNNLFALHAQVSADSGWTASMQYDPTYEIGSDNWLDGVDFVDGVDADMMGMPLDGGNAGSDPLTIAGHRTLAAGNKIAFFAYDPLSLNSQAPEYWWYGFTGDSPQNAALNWFNAVSVDENITTLPEEYSLSQNYPNPFNPATIISYSIPEKADVVLKVYNLLGQEVAKLVSEVKNVGTHEVNFNANNLTSGVYFYTIKAGSFTSTKKMMLIK